MFRNAIGLARRGRLSLIPICLRIETAPSGIDRLIMKMIIATLHIFLVHSHVAHRTDHLPSDNLIADADILLVRVEQFV